jgi:hypothetical protein
MPIGVQAPGVFEVITRIETGRDVRIADVNGEEHV